MAIGNIDDETASYLRDIHDLDHLFIEECHGPMTHYGVVQGLIRNSISTLRSLYLHQVALEIDGVYLFGSENDELVSKCSSLQVLDCFNLLYHVDSVEKMMDRIDFTQLSSLTFEHVEGSSSSLFNPLTEVFREATQQRDSHGIKLRRLLLNADYAFEPQMEESNGFESYELSSSCRFAFLASFSSLTSLEISNYGRYPYEWSNKTTGFPALVMDAILKHKDLRTLKITNRFGSTLKTLHLTTNNIDAIISGLPHLEHFDFSLTEKYMVGIPACLVQSRPKQC